MIQIALHRSQSRPGYRGFAAEGHAMAAAEGELDLVCCAVSVLTATGANALEEVAGITPVEAEGDGKVACFLPPDTTEQEWETAQIILRTMECGLAGIAARHPDLIRIQRI